MIRIMLRLRADAGPLLHNNWPWVCRFCRGLDQCKVLLIFVHDTCLG